MQTLLMVQKLDFFFFWGGKVRDNVILVQYAPFSLTAYNYYKKQKSYNQTALAINSSVPHFPGESAFLANNFCDWNFLVFVKLWVCFGCIS